jgi:hypothetical protein
MSQLSGFMPDVITYSSAIRACERIEQWMQALRLLVVMQLSLLVPNIITCSAVCLACTYVEQWQQALSLWAILQLFSFMSSVLVKRVRNDCRHLVVWRLCSSLYSCPLSSPTVLSSVFVSKVSTGSRHWVFGFRIMISDLVRSFTNL